MLYNPYTPKRRFVTAHGDPLPDNLRFRGQQSRAIAANGDINASSTADIMGQIGRLMASYQSGDIVQAHPMEERKALADARRQVLAEAYEDSTGETWKAIGQAIAEDISETADREGFMRRLSVFEELQQGQDAKVRFKTKDVVAVMATTASEVTPTFIRNNVQNLPEIYIGDNVLVEERDIGQSTGDILEESYQDGLEAIMVQEDRLWKQMADEASAVYNTVTYFSTFTPLHFSQIRSQVTGWGIPGAYCILAYDLWDDIIGTTGFSDWFSPVEKHELVLEGNLGMMLGLQLITDAFRLPELKVLDTGDIYVVGTPETHAALRQRGDISANPITKYEDAAPLRGWYIFEIIAFMIVGAKSVAVGRRS